MSHWLAVPSFYLVRSETVDSSLTPFLFPHILSNLSGKSGNLVFKICQETNSSHHLHCYFPGLIILFSYLDYSDGLSLCASTSSFIYPYASTHNPFTPVISSFYFFHSGYHLLMDFVIYLFLWFLHISM